MDLETLSNHISKLGKTYFDNACKIVLQDVFQLNAINVMEKVMEGQILPLSQVLEKESMSVIKLQLRNLI